MVLVVKIEIGFLTTIHRLMFLLEIQVFQKKKCNTGLSNTGYCSETNVSVVYCYVWNIIEMNYCDPSDKLADLSDMLWHRYNIFLTALNNLKCYSGYIGFGNPLCFVTKRLLGS